MDGLEKVALLLKHMDANVVQAVLARLGPERAESVRSRMKALGAGPQLRAGLREILAELDALVRELAPPPAAPPVHQSATAHVVDRVIADEAPAAEVAAPSEPELPADPLQGVRLLAPENLALALQGESARTVALVLNHLEVDQAGAVYKRLPAELRREVSLQFARQVTPPQEVLRRIAQGVVLKARRLEQTARPADESDRARKMAALVRQLDRAERLELLGALEEKDLVTAQRIKDQLYQFDDILLMENTSVQKLLAELDTKSLAVALKGSPPAIRDKILANLSKRAQETLTEEMELLGAVSGARLEQAKRGVVEAIQRLDARGELLMNE